MNLRDIFFLKAIDNPEIFDKGLKIGLFEKTMTWPRFGVVFSPIGEDSAIRFYRSKSDFREGKEEDRRTLPCLSRLMARSNPCRMQESVQQERKKRQESALAGR